MRRLVLWTGLDSWRTEVANLEVDDDRLVAIGTRLAEDQATKEWFAAEAAGKAGAPTKKLTAAVKAKAARGSSARKST